MEVVTPFAGVWIEIVIRPLLLSFWITVTPFAGVWIEMAVLAVYHPGLKLSLPSRECGLKSPLHCPSAQNRGHSLRGSVDWNAFTAMAKHQDSVTPFAGVWIEIHQIECLTTDISSLPSRECGLKYILTSSLFKISCSHSLRGSVDWNCVRFTALENQLMSLPSRECGLKCC